MIRYADARQRWAHVNPALGHYLATRLSRFNPRRYRELRYFVARWLAEIPQFAAFDPTQDELRSLVGLRLLCTVGADSGPERHAAAGVLARLAGAEVAVVPGAGNAVQLDAPLAFAQLVRTWLALPVGARP